jgi:hypothetical protein
MFTSLLAVVAITRLHGFLAPTQPVAPCEILEVEGWLPDVALAEALDYFQTRGCRRLLTTGLPVYRGSMLAAYGNFAEVAAATLRQLGLDESRLVVIPAPSVIRDRTYASAVAVAQWLEHTHRQVRTVNIVSIGVHARPPGCCSINCLANVWRSASSLPGCTITIRIAGGPQVSAFGEWWEKPLHTCTHGFSFIPNHERNPVGAP